MPFRPCIYVLYINAVQINLIRPDAIDFRETARCWRMINSFTDRKNNWLPRSYSVFFQVIENAVSIVALQ